MFFIENVYLQKGSFVLNIPYLEIPSQGLTLLSGPSGSGKSLFLKVMMGLEKSDKKFKWIVQEKDLAKLSSPDRRLGVVFQTLELFPHLTAEENILFHVRARKLDMKKSKERLLKLAAMAKLTDRLNHKVGVLSGGERQRVAILRAVMGNPHVLLMDEPFSSLDENLKNELRVFLKELIQKENIPCILVSHDLRDKEIADKIIYIEEGRVVLIKPCQK